MTDDRSPQAASDPEVASALGLDPASRRRTIWRRIFRIGALLLLVAGAILVGRRLTRVVPTEYVTAPLKKGDLTITVAATGTLAPVRLVEVGSEISGRIRTVEVDFNDLVTAGQVLAEIDTEQLDAQVLRGEASLDGAKAALAQAAAAIDEAEGAIAQSVAAVHESDATIVEARATVAEARARKERAERLATGEAVAPQDIEAATAALARAEAGLARAEAGRQRAVASRTAAEAGKVRAEAAQASAAAQVRVAQASLDADRTSLAKAQIRSPIDGIVLTRTVEPGQTVAASFQTPILFTIAGSLAQMELRVDVDEADIGLVRIGQEATFTVDAYPSRPFPGRIVALRNAARTVQGVVSYEAILAVDNAAGLLRPGMTATAEIVVDTRRDILLVPAGALRFTPPPPPGKRPETKTSIERDAPQPPHVWTLEDGVPKSRPIEIGLTDGQWTEVRGGDLGEGDEVLVDVVEPEDAAP